MSLALDLDRLSVQMGDNRLLDDVCLEVPAGRIIAVIGSNGAGKTTLLDVVCGLVDTVHGTASVDGRPAGYAPGRRPDPHVLGRAFQGSPLPATLTVRELAVSVTGSQPAADELLDRFRLRQHEGSFVSELSTGMRRILDIAVATVHSPKVLLLDEPASGLSPSEIEPLAEMVLNWRDRTGGAVLLVEHDVTLVRRVADEAIVLDRGRVVERGDPARLLDHPPSVQRRLADPNGDRFGHALHQVAERAAPAAPPLRHTLSTWTVLRLSFVAFSTGLASAMILGVLNRVLKVELGVSLVVIAPILASYNLAAPLALVVGHLSDTRPILGRHRTPYIVLGSLVSGVGLVLAPTVTGWLTTGLGIVTVVSALLLFVLLGLGLYGSQTVFFALLADLVDPRERGNAASMSYVMLMCGVLAGVALSASILDAEAGGLQTLFAVGGVSVVALTVMAVWGVEARRPAGTVAAQHAPASLLTSIRSMAAIRQARVFFVFMVASTVFVLFHRAVLEPFGGDVLGLDVRVTAVFNAVFTIGFLLGMLVAGRGLADRIGHRRTAAVGLVGASAAFLGLSGAAAAAASPPAWISIFFVGLAVGVFNVGALSLMMGMVRAGRAALFMGVWSSAHALSDGLGTASGGFVFEGVASALGSVPGGYAAVFAVQAVGALACILLLRRVDPSGIEERFAAVRAARSGAPPAHPAGPPDPGASDVTPVIPPRPVAPPLAGPGPGPPER